MSFLVLQFIIFHDFTFVVGKCWCWSVFVFFVFCFLFLGPLPRPNSKNIKFKENVKSQLDHKSTCPRWRGSKQRYNVVADQVCSSLLVYLISWSGRKMVKHIFGQTMALFGGRQAGGAASPTGSLGVG